MSVWITRDMEEKDYISIWWKRKPIFDSEEKKFIDQKECESLCEIKEFYNATGVQLKEGEIRRVKKIEFEFY
ncbi:MAG: hypothetical protein ACE5HR_00275 [bacterium]